MLCELLPTRHCVVLPPRPNDARERSSSSMAPSLNELDARLRALREQLGDDVSSSESEEDGDGGSESSLQSIPPLPTHCLPEFYTQEASQKRGGIPLEPPPLRRVAAAAGGDGAVEKVKPRKKRKVEETGEADAAPGTAEEVASGSDRPACVTCGLRFTSAAQLEEHKQGKRHRQHERQKHLGAQAHAPATAVPRRAASGKRPMVELQGPACALCRKSFTSEAQLQEHIGGKWHQMRLQGAKQPKNG